MGDRSVVKNALLQTLKTQFKGAVQNQYKTEPDKVKNADITKNAKDIIKNKQVILALRVARLSVTQEEIEKILTEIRDEVIAENAT